MGNLVVKMLVTFAHTLLTQKLFNKLIVEMCWAGAKKSQTKIDDRLIIDMAKALGVELPAKEVAAALEQ